MASRVWPPVADHFLDSYEIAVMRNLLRIIDNPMLDVALVSVMLSPIGSFSADDVTRIRLAGKKNRRFGLGYVMIWKTKADRLSN